MKRGEMDAALESMNQVIAVLKEVNNVRQLWQAHVSTAGAFDRLGRSDNSHKHWGAAVQLIENTGNGLFDRQLWEDFVSAGTVKEILRKTYG